MEKVKLNLKKFSTGGGSESTVTSGNLQLAKPLATDN